MNQVVDTESPVAAGGQADFSAIGGALMLLLTPMLKRLMGYVR